MHTSQFITQPFSQYSENSLQLFHDCLSDLSQHLELPELVPNEFNVCSLALSDEHWIHISYSTDDRRVHWTSAMASVASKEITSLTRTLLALNLDWQQTQGGFFAFDDITEVIFYRHHELIFNLPTQQFLEVTEHFIERSDFWKKHLQQTIDQLASSYAETALHTSHAQLHSLHFSVEPL